MLWSKNPNSLQVKQERSPGADCKPGLGKRKGPCDAAALELLPRPAPLSATEICLSNANPCRCSSCPLAALLGQAQPWHSPRPHHPPLSQNWNSTGKKLLCLSLQITGMILGLVQRLAGITLQAVFLICQTIPFPLPSIIFTAPQRAQGPARPGGRWEPNPRAPDSSLLIPFAIRHNNNNQNELIRY